MIHSEHPFRPEPGDLDPARRFRGRIAAGVTIVTAGTGSKPTGLTVSSLLVIEGDPAYVELVVLVAGAGHRSSVCFELVVLVDTARRPTPS